MVPQFLLQECKEHSTNLLASITVYGFQYHLIPKILHRLPDIPKYNMFTIFCVNIIFAQTLNICITVDSQPEFSMNLTIAFDSSQSLFSATI